MNSEIEFLRDLAVDVDRALSAGRGRWVGRRGPSARVAVGLACAIVAAGGAIAYLVGATGHSHASASGTRPRSTTSTAPGTGGAIIDGIPMPPIGKNPFILGTRGPVTLATAIRTAGYPFPVSDARAANAGNLSYVWTDWWGRLPALRGNGRGGIAREVVLQYASTGVRVFIHPTEGTWPAGPRAAMAGWRTMATEFAGGSTRWLHGSPALILTGPDDDSPQGYLSTGVDMIDFHSTVPIEIDVDGSTRISRPAVIAIAESMAASAARMS